MADLSDQIFFRPWIGKRYDTGGLFRRRVLFLGESHYLWNEAASATPSLTRDCIEEQYRGDASHAFWTRIVIAGLGRKPSLEEKQRFWDSVAFYNFIQTPVGYGPRVRPAPAMWTDAQPPFLEILEALMPHLVIVLGREMWHNLPEGFVPGPPFGRDRSAESWWYIVADARGRARTRTPALAVGFRHPSAGFSGSYWHGVFREALDHVRSRRTSSQ